MNIHENVATQALTSFFYHEPLWKKEILFNFLLKPFNLSLTDIKDVKTQDNLKETIPDFSIITNNGKKIRYEIKINNADLTLSEKKTNTRDAYLICKDYSHYDDIPPLLKKEKKILYWEDLFEIIDKLGATKEFARFDLVREYMKVPDFTLLFSIHEVAMFYSPKTVSAVYSMTKKLLGLFDYFLETNNKDYEKTGEENDEIGIGYFFGEKKNQKRAFFIGLAPSVENQDYYYAIELQIEDNMKTEGWYIEGEYAYFPLDKELLTKYDSDEEKLKQEFNKNVVSVINSIK